MNYISTRGSRVDSTARALLQGLAEDGGLLIPEELKKIEFSDEEIENLNYSDFAFKVISTVFDDLDKERLKREIKEAYKTFDEDILPVKKLDNMYVMELFHGKTRAFKDFALSLLPRLINMAKDSLGIDDKILVLTATSGDTGSAAISGFYGQKDTEIMVFYPTDGISMVQRNQMLESGCAVAIRGNFDDAQSALKEIFSDTDFKNKLNEKGYRLISANSINIGRLVPQIAYYFYSYYKLVKMGEIKREDEVSVTVPTGNFGNILASYIAKSMGLPIKNFICASNKNNVLEDFLNSKKYDVKRKFYKTNSPSMDILISSNLERYLYFKSNDSEEIESLMSDLKNKKEFVFEHELDIFGYSCGEEKTIETISEIYKKYNYIIDTHTAVAIYATSEYLKSRAKSSDEKVLVAATASAVKFPNSIKEAIGFLASDEKDSLLKVAEMTGDLEFAKRMTGDLKETVIDKEDIKKTIEERIF